MKNVWPRGVHPKHGSLYLVKKNKWHYLCRIDEGEHALYKSLAAISDPKPRLLREIFPFYLAQAKIAPATFKNYARVLSTSEESPGILTEVFGHGHPDSWKPTHIKQFLARRRDDGVAASGNRERAALSSVYEFAMEKGWAISNPCRGVRRNKEKPSKRYVDHAELTKTYDRSPEHLKHLMNAAYLSGIRLTDLKKLRREQLIREHGAIIAIDFSESKTGKDNLMSVGPALREVLDRAIAYGDSVCTKITVKLKRPRPLPSVVFVNSRGKPWTQWAVSSAMARADATFAIRHLRRKAQTDAQDKNVLGHTGQMRERYISKRKLESVG